MHVDLPWPDRRLHPNARVHRMAKAGASRKARANSAWLAKAAGLRKIDAASIKVTAIFFPPDNRGRDLDGMLSNIKPHLDGIADVIGIDDRHWRLALERAEMVEGGNVRIQIEVIA